VNPSVQRTGLVYGRVQDGWQGSGRCVWSETREQVILFTSRACRNVLGGNFCDFSLYKGVYRKGLTGQHI
jgi:hypothetical protein